MQNEAMRNEAIREETKKMSKEQAVSAFNSHVIELDTANLPVDPTNFQEAMDSPFHEQWIRSMREELSSLHENNTWDTTSLADKTHSGAIRSKWVFKTKPNSDGTIRFKSKLVVKITNKL